MSQLVRVRVRKSGTVTRRRHHHSATTTLPPCSTGRSAIRSGLDTHRGTRSRPPPEATHIPPLPPNAHTPDDPLLNKGVPQGPGRAGSRAHEDQGCTRVTPA
ncbi:hypothetical protein E2C01_038155 [Portunus trituberculatus]|uniref:Uncharacterized protein n=1 Tax=Portunus trituberculatus TaxID=210409 RepID=A0A5B7FDE9_PORTR|nr:hypothetical protein [Portunus trituberculatus]